MRVRATGAAIAAGRPAEDPDYRFAVIQSELYRRYLRLTVERLDVRPLAHYLKHLALWYLESERERAGGARRAHAARPQRTRTWPGVFALSTLLIDNYDSYTYNVFHLLAAVSGEEPIVVRNDVVSWRALSRWDFDAIVLSPGPGRPERWHDFGVCSDILRFSEVPVLGVCLGHQGLGHLLGGAVRSAPMVMHGRLSAVKHDGEGLFAGIPQDFSVVRYHSLAVAGDLGPQGRVTAWTNDGVVMGIEHRSRPMWGVQFHPESIATEHGRRLVENFYALARERRSTRASRGWLRRPSVDAAPGAPRARQAGPADDAPSAAVRSVEGERVGRAVVRAAVWRSAARLLAGQRGRPHAAGGVLVPRHDGRAPIAACSNTTSHDKSVTFASRRARARPSTGSIFDILDRELAERTIEHPRRELPHGLLGGFVGYLGYECKADCGSPNVHRSDLPDAVLMLANRVVASTTLTHRTHLLALCDEDDGWTPSCWLDRTRRRSRGKRLRDAGPPALLAADTPSRRRSSEERSATFRCGRGREQYLADIARCQAALAAGESYEVCLTDQIHTDAQPGPVRPVSRAAAAQPGAVRRLPQAR